MTYINDIHDYSESFIDKFTQQVLPIYDLWDIRPLQNDHKRLKSGTSSDKQLFREFLQKHVEQDYPFPLKIIVGNIINGTKEMGKTKRQAYKIKFDQFKDIDPEEHLPFFSSGQNMHQNPHLPFNGLNGQGLMGKPILAEMQETIKQLKEDAVRRDAEYQRRSLEQQKEMEEYRFQIREERLKEREQQFFQNMESQQEQFQQYMNENMATMQQQMQQFQAEKARGLYNIQDVAQSIGAGIVDLGKSYLGADGLFTNKNKESNNKAQSANKTESPQTESNLSGGNYQSMFKKKSNSDETIIEDEQIDEDHETLDYEQEYERTLDFFFNMDYESKGELLKTLFENLKDETEHRKAEIEIEGESDIKDEDVKNSQESEDNNQNFEDDESKSGDGNDDEPPEEE